MGAGLAALSGRLTRESLPYGQARHIKLQLPRARVSTPYPDRSIQLGPPPAVHGTERRLQMSTILIVLLVLFLLGGGSWGYSRWRG
jgi:hypothetical protein